MNIAQPLRPAKELAANNGVRFPNESADYRRARDALLAEEIELRRHVERVVPQRRALPTGGVLPEDHDFVREHGPVKFSGLFGDTQTLVVYSYMFGPQRKQSSEMGMASADPGQGPRVGPDPMPRWTLLDSTPEGRGKGGNPALSYPHPELPTTR